MTFKPTAESDGSVTFAVGTEPGSSSPEDDIAVFVPIPPESVSVTGGVQTSLSASPSENWVREHLEEDSAAQSQHIELPSLPITQPQVAADSGGCPPTVVSNNEDAAARYAACFRWDPNRKAEEEIGLGIPSSLGIDISSITEIGYGAQARVFTATLLETSQKIAVKRYHDIKGRSVMRTNREYVILERLEGHPFVGEALRVEHDREHNCSYLLMSYGGVDLNEWRAKQVSRGLLDEETIRQLTMRMVLAFEHLQDNGVFHTDVKPGNTLVDDENNPRVIDFGLAVSARLPGDHKEEIRHAYGTPGHQSPEHAIRGVVTRESDFFTVIQTIVSVFTGKRHPLKLTFGMKPDASQEFFEEWISNIEGVLQELEISNQALDFIKAILKLDANERLTLRQAMQHPWMRGIFDIKAQFHKPAPASPPTFPRKRKAEDQECSRPAKRV